MFDLITDLLVQHSMYPLDLAVYIMPFLSPETTYYTHLNQKRCLNQEEHMSYYSGVSGAIVNKNIFCYRSPNTARLYVQIVGHPARKQQAWEQYEGVTKICSDSDFEYCTDEDDEGDEGDEIEWETLA